MSRAKVSSALLAALGFSDLDLVDVVAFWYRKSQGSHQDLRRYLESEVGLSSGDAAKVSDALCDLGAPLRTDEDPSQAVKRTRTHASSASEAPGPVTFSKSPAEGQKPAASVSGAADVSSDGVLNDPVLAAKAGRFEDMKEDPIYMGQLREEARRSYLKKREAEQLELSEKLLADREWLYKGTAIALSDAEKRDIRLQRQTLDIAKRVIVERKEKGSLDAYVMPESYDDTTEKRLAVVRQKWKESAVDSGLTESTFTSDQTILETQRGVGVPQPKILKEKEALAKRDRQYALMDETGAEIEFVPGDVLSETLPFDILEDEGNESYNLGREEREQRALEKRMEKGQLLQAERKKLPVFSYRKELLKAIRRFPVLIVVGETGSGKTTQIPQYLLEVGYGKLGRIGCTQPRRVAAMSVAARVANEMGVKLGHEVGYAIRFEDCTTDKTVIKYMTDGMLLREFMTEPDLASYSVVMIDEAHERTLHTDVLFGLVKDLSRYRSEDFRLIVSSATLEAEKFSEYFDGAPIFKIPGRRHPVSVYYTKVPEANFLDATVITILQIHLSQPLGSGDILVFLPGTPTARLRGLP